MTHFLRIGLIFLASILTSAALADVGPALSGITARNNDASSVFWSPAGITRIDQPELLLDTAMVYMSSKFEVEETNRTGGDAAFDGTALLVPGMYYAKPLNERTTAGFSLTAPGGFGNDYGKSWSGRYLTEKTQLAFMALTFTLGYKLTDQWSIGGGPIFMYVHSKSQARVNNLIGPDGKARITESGFGLGGQIGLMYDISDTARVAMVYRTPFSPDLSGTPRFWDINPVLGEAIKSKDLHLKGINVDLNVPQTAQLGYFKEFNNGWSFTLDAVWLDTSEFQIEHISIGEEGISIPATFKDNWSFSAGLRYEYQPDRAFVAGASYTTSAARDSDRTLALPLDRVIAVGAGLEFKWKDFEVHTSVNYADLGDNNIDQDGGLLRGRVKGSFGYYHAVVVDLQLIKRF